MSSVANLSILKGFKSFWKISRISSYYYFIMLYRTVLETAPLCEYKLNAPWSIQWDNTGLFPFSCPFHIYVPGD